MSTVWGFSWRGAGLGYGFSTFSGVCGETLVRLLVCPPFGAFCGEVLVLGVVSPRFHGICGEILWRDLSQGLGEVCSRKSVGGGTAAGIYGVRRLQVGSCGRLGLGPSSLPTVALYRATSLAFCVEILVGFSVCPPIGQFCGETFTRDLVCPRLGRFCGETVT